MSSPFVTASLNSSLNSSLLAVHSSKDVHASRDVVSKQAVDSPVDRRCCRRCMPCCSDSVSWRSSSCDCRSKRFVESMTLFEDRNVEALYLQHAKRSRRANIVPVGIMTLALALTVVSLFLRGYVQLFFLWIPVTAFLLAVAGTTASCAQRCFGRVQYQLRAASLALALATATLAFFFFNFAGVFNFGSIAPLGLLWVCQKALVISDVVAARVLVVIVPFNTLMLLAGVAWQLEYLLLVPQFFPLAAVARAIFELGTSVVTCSGVLLWLALRTESASRTVFYWNRVVGINVDSLDAEANPFHQRRLLDWLSRGTSEREMRNSRGHTGAREFWELDGKLLRLHSKIAAGGGGLVWKATYKAKAVAAKQLYSGLCAGSEQLEELAAEVTVLAQLSHVNIVRFLGLCRHPAGSQADHSVYLPMFIVQEYCATNLRAVLTNVFPALPSTKRESEVRRVALEIARALVYLHSRKVVHRDLKPENVLLTNQHTVRVADFGISVQYFDDPRSLESVGGTPAYMSPELLCPQLFTAHGASKEPLADEMSSDVYAYGVVLCELAHSNTDGGVMNVLAENADHNRRLARSTVHHVDLERRWTFPPFDIVKEEPLRPCSDLGSRCCALRSNKRPSFVEICEELGTLTTKSPQVDRHDLQLHARPRSVHGTGGSYGRSNLSHVRPPLRTRQVPSTSFTPTTDFTVEQHRQVALDKCSCSCWSRSRLRFEDDDMERRFVAFLHTEEFFRYLRWPYVVLATLQLAFAVAMFVVNRGHYVLYPVMLTVLFGAAALFSWLPRLQRFSMVTLLTVALLAGLVQCGVVWANLITNPIVALVNISGFNVTVCVCDVAPSGQCPSLCEETAFEWLYINLLLPMLQDLTTPVTLLILGLPLYLYSWLFALSAVSWVGTVAGGLFIWFNGADYFFSMEEFLTIAVPGLALFPICATTAIAGERTRRKMFLKLCSLRFEESHLLERATFRGYRDALVANWRFLATSEEKVAGRTKPRHVVTAATV